MISRRATMGGLAAVAISVLGCAADGSGDPLSDAEADLLRFLREEEKVARDVYASLGSFGDPFANVAESEQRHMDAVLRLLDAYGLADPSEGRGAGEFEDDALQSLYEALVAEGAGGLRDALRVGCKIEELDLRDLEAARAASEHEDVIATLDELARGSRNHLRAFYGRLVQEGGSYEPAYVDPETFHAIVSSAPERGRGAAR